MKASRFFLLVFFLVACSEPAPTERLAAPTESKVSAANEPTSVVPDSQSACKTRLQDLKTHWQFSIDSEAKAEFDGAVTFARSFAKREDLLEFLQGFLQELFNGEVCFGTIHFQTRSDGGVFWQGLARASDAKAYFAKTITWPEWTRRLELKSEASLEGVKTKLKDAQARRDQNDIILWAETWLAQEPHNTVPQLILGNVALQRQVFDLALAHYDSVLQTDPKNEIALFNRAYANAQSGRLEIAAAQYLELLDRFEELGFRSTTRDVLRLHLAGVLLRSGQGVEAEKNLNLIASSSFEKDLFVLELERTKKDFTAAAARLQNLRARYPSSDIVLYNAIVIELDLKNFTNAKSLYADLQKISPETARDFAFLELWQEPSDAPAPAPKDEGTNAP